MDGLIGYIVVGGVCFFAGWWLKEQVMLFNMLKNAEQIVKSLERIQELRAEYEEVESNPTTAGDTDGTELAIERVGNVLYAYNKETNQFVAQGPDLTSLLESAQSRFPNIKFFGTIPNGDSAKELAK